MKSASKSFRPSFFNRSALFALVFAGVGAVGSLHAAGPSPANGGKPADSYAAMCMQAVDIPDPYGEADLKGNAKLADYCKCFGGKFLERAMKATPGAKPPPLEQQNKEEFAMRQSCRAQFNLPAPKKQ